MIRARSRLGTLGVAAAVVLTSATVAACGGGDGGGGGESSGGTTTLTFVHLVRGPADRELLAAGGQLTDQVRQRAVEGVASGLGAQAPCRT